MLTRTAEKFPGSFVTLCEIKLSGKWFRRTGTFSEHPKGNTILTDLEVSWQTLKRLPWRLDLLTTSESESARPWSLLIRVCRLGIEIYRESEKERLGFRLQGGVLGPQLQMSSVKYPLSIQCEGMQGGWSMGSSVELRAIIWKSCVYTLMLIW